MGKVEVWETLPSFRMWPKKTFFGLDKNRAHCFTLPKEVTDRFIRHFALREGRLQRDITFLIRDHEYPAEVRWARINRSRPYKLQAEDLPERDVIQFQWPREELTRGAMRDNLREAYDLIASGERNENHSVTFHHAGESSFIVIFHQK
jgi:hypothetical protein